MYVDSARYFFRADLSIAFCGLWNSKIGYFLWSVMMLQGLDNTGTMIELSRRHSERNLKWCCKTYRIGQQVDFHPSFVCPCRCPGKGIGTPNTEKLVCHLREFPQLTQLPDSRDLNPTDSTAQHKPQEKGLFTHNREVVNISTWGKTTLFCPYPARRQDWTKM